MNELIVQPFFWGDSLAALLAFYVFIVALISACFLITEGEFTIEGNWLLALTLFGVSIYILFIYVSLYGEVISQWLSTIF